MSRNKVMELEQWMDKNGHNCVMLYKNGKGEARRVDHLVLETFIGACPPGHECRHIDGDVQNDNLENLEWVVKN